MLKLLPYISTYSGLLPLLAGVLFARRRPFVLFTAFIALGLLVDLVAGHVASNETGHLCMFLYSLIDILFLGYFVFFVLYPSSKAGLKISSGILTCVFWFITYKMWAPSFEAFPEYSFIFDTTMEVLLALIAAYALLKITEGLDESLTQDYLFFLTGIFFYNFCTFFIHSFIGDDFVEHIWFLGCIINIITMLIYTYAFYRQRSQNRHLVYPENEWLSDQLHIRYKN